MKKIGWIGLGVMGNPMAKNLIQAGYELYVYNRTPEKANNLVELGAVYCENIGMLVENSDVICSIVGDPSSVEKIYFGEGGIFSKIAADKFIIDFTTTKPSLSHKIYDTANENGCGALDAPVSGGDVGVQNGELSIMVGGDEEDFKKLLPLFEVLGKTVIYTGSAGTGQHTKMANQISIAGNTIALCESLVYAQKAGLDIEKTISVVSGGAAGSWGWTNLAPRIHRGELDTCFYIKHFVKDMRIALEECQRMDIALPGLALVHQLYTSLVALGHQDLGTQALIKILRKINNITEV